AAQRCLTARASTKEQRKGPLQAACKDAVLGLVGLGQACSGTIECCRERKCMDDKAGAIGAPCEADIHCERGLYCRGLLKLENVGGPAACAPQKPSGEACTRSSECKGKCASDKCMSFCGSG